MYICLKYFNPLLPEFFFFFFCFSGHSLGSFHLPTHSRDAHTKFLWWSLLKLKSKFWRNVPNMARYVIKGLMWWLYRKFFIYTSKHSEQITKKWYFITKLPYVLIELTPIHGQGYTVLWEIYIYSWTKNSFKLCQIVYLMWSCISFSSLKMKGKVSHD